MSPRSWLLKAAAVGLTASSLAFVAGAAQVASASPKLTVSTGSVATRHAGSDVFCGGVAYAPPGGGYGTPSQATDAIIGSPGYEQGYTWKVQGNVGTPVGAQALGFDSNGHAEWYNIGVSFGDGSGTVPWGNILAYPEVRVESGAINGVEVTWSCNSSPPT